MRRRAAWLLLFAAALLLRLAHASILWVEECYPAAAAIQMLHGKLPYRDFFFDKPPLSALVYLLWGAMTGWPLRLAGALFVVLCSWLAWRLARQLWSEHEAWIAAGALAFFLTFDTPSAAIPLAPDMLMIAPHLAAVYFASRARPLLAGLCCALAFLTNTKAVFVLAVCLAWNPALAPWTLAGFAPALLAVPMMWEQVFRFGQLYAGDSFVANPWTTGLSRTLSWTAFHAAAVIPSAYFLYKERSKRLLVWIAFSFIAVSLGARFFPRYYFQLLPAAAIAASRGLTLLPRKWAIAAALLLLLPLARYGPRFAQVNEQWADTAMYRDSREASAIINSNAGPSDTILIWGYRPDILVLTRLALGTPWLDSQPLTGVLADRHLFDTHETIPEQAAANRRHLATLRPTWIVDGLGPYNKKLAISGYADLTAFLGSYRQVARTQGCRIYRLTPYP